MPTKIEIEQIERLRKSQNNLEWDSGSGWVQLNGGTSNIESNYIQDTSANYDSNVSNWQAYQESGSKPTTGQGGSPDIGFARNSTNPISGTGDFQITKPGLASHIGEGISYDFTIEPRHNARVLQISVDYKVHSGDYQTEDLTCYIIDIDSGEVVEPSNVHFENLDSKLTGRFLTTFQTHIENVNYRLCFHIATDSTREWSFVFNNVRVWEPQQSVGAIITDWQEYDLQVTATATNPTLGTHNKKAYWRRNGSDCEVMFSIERTSVGTKGSGDYLFSIPFPKNNTYLPNNDKTGLELLGSSAVHIAENLASSSGVGYVGFYDDNNVILYILTETNYTEPIGSSYFPLHDPTGHISAKFSYPVAGWGSTVTAVQGDSQRSVAFSAYGASGSHTASSTYQTVPVSNIVNDTHNIWDSNSHKAIIPKSGFYICYASIMFGSTSFDTYIATYVNGEVGSKTGSRANSSYSIGSNNTLFGYLKAGDEIDFRAFQSSGTSMPYNEDGGFNYFFIAEIGNPTNSITVNETIACKYTTESDLPIPNGIEEKILFDQKSYDTHSAYNTTTGDYTIAEAGIYSIKVFLLFMKHPVGARRISIWVNGILEAYGTNLLASSNSVNWGHCLIEDEFSLKKGDVVTIKAVQTSGAPLALHNHKATNRLLIRKVG
ncbi:MAG: hypothetical protein AAF518_01185 [Spirochaetota bacterium]